MCARQSWNPVPAKPSTVATLFLREQLTLIPRTRAGMHWVREEGFQGLRTLSVETGEQFTCPLCRQPVTFARKYETGGR